MPSLPASGLKVFSFKGRTKILHLTWVAFFISFFVWFSHAPLMATMRDALGMSDQEVKALLIMNIALTIPARIIIGMLVDKVGPRITYSTLLMVSGVLCIVSSFAQTFEMMALTRFLLGFVGAGFVIGIRMIGEWFPAKQVGVAEGIYGGWGNFGSAAAAMSLPAIAMLYGGDDGWRYAIASVGVVAMVYSLIYFFNVTDTPQGATYFKPNKVGAMEVSSRNDMILYGLTKLPLFLAMGVLNWKLGPDNLGIINEGAMLVIYISLGGLYLYQGLHIYDVNKHIFKEVVPEIHRYKFKQVAVLNLAYLVTFGSELAVVSMLPMFFQDTFDLSIIMAGLLASGFAFMNLVARPGGGLLSDRYGRKKTLLILLGGLTIGYLVLSQIDSSWAIWVAVVAMMTCSFFVQAGEGAVFSMVPLIKRRMTGQIAGNVGANGNVGGVCFLTVLSFVSPEAFFITIACSAAIVMVITYIFLDEPKGHMAEVLPDGTVELIDVS
ncbi:MAG: NarK family nitrate/nitrite MFS transporter [Magnetovibrio sp.]|nr:NarK family nitrate/nitrite MFS transporter [Magnetovibrio sp.]